MKKSSVIKAETEFENRRLKGEIMLLENNLKGALGLFEAQVCLNSALVQSLDILKDYMCALGKINMSLREGPFKAENPAQMHEYYSQIQLQALKYIDQLDRQAESLEKTSRKALGVLQRSRRK